VLSTFILGLALALVFNDQRIRGLKIYRSIFILPYAFPAFLSAYVWKGMLNTQNGFINNTILSFMGDNKIQWFEQQGAARAAVLLVNLWLGFPYMFLICTGALQAIPNDLTEAASIDGASAWKIIRLIKLPLLLVSLAPLLIPSFAYNFNNFGAIYLLTGGGPFLDQTLKVTVGATDILITFVYRIAFSGSIGADYGLASAFSVLIFMLIGSISFFSFKRTKGLERVNTMTTLQTRHPKAKRGGFIRWFTQVGWKHLVGLVVIVFATFPLVYILSTSLTKMGNIENFTLFRSFYLGNYKDLLNSTDYPLCDLDEKHLNPCWRNCRYQRIY